MATRAIVSIESKTGDNKKPILSIYKHWDGDPGSLGLLIYSFLTKMKFSFGSTRYSDEGEFVCNGSQEFASNLVAFLKKLHPNGDVYVAGADAKGMGEEYTYKITIQDYDHAEPSEISEIKAIRTRQMFSCSEGGHDHIIRSFGAFVHKKLSMTTASVARIQALSTLVTPGMISRNATQVLLSEIKNNECLVDFDVLLGWRSAEDKPKEAEGYITMPVVTDELMRAIQKTLPNVAISNIRLRVLFTETFAGSNRYQLKNVGAVLATCVPADGLSRAKDEHRIDSIKVEASDVYGLFLNADGTGKVIGVDKSNEDHCLDMIFNADTPLSHERCDSESHDPLLPSN